MKSRMTLLLTLCLLITFACLIPQAQAVEPVEYYDRVNAFINDSRWKNGAAYGDGQPPKSGITANCWECYAYTADFVHEVWNLPTTTKDYRPARAGVSFTDPDEITAGDVIRIDSGGDMNIHYYVVLARYSDGTLWTAEGNCDHDDKSSTTSIARISKTAYSVSSPGDTVGSIKRSMSVGWHMPSYTAMDTSSAGNYFNVTVDEGYIRHGYYDILDVAHTAAKHDAFRILGSQINSHDNKWYCVEFGGGQKGWIYEKRGTVYQPWTATVENVNRNYVAPIHNDFYGKADIIGQASSGDKMTVIGETVNKHNNTWYHVLYNGTEGWIWEDYISTTRQITVVRKELNSYRVIEDPEMGLSTDDLSSSGGCSYDAAGATSFIVPDNATSIDSLTNAASLKTITIPTSVTSIGANAFSKCTALTTVYYTGTTAQWNAISVSGTGNANLTAAKLVCQGDAASTASFTTVTATPATTNAMLNATVTVTSGSGTFTGSGIRVYNSSGTVIASKDETHSYYREASGKNSYNIWYDVTDELGKKLTAGTTYSYQFYTIFNGVTIWSGKKSFTTSGESMNFTFTLEAVTEDSFTFSFRGDASTRGVFSEFGCKLIDLNTGETEMDYSNTDDANLNVANAQYFSINSWKLSGEAGHTYSVQLYYVFNGTKYSSSVYTVTFPDSTKPVISDAAVTSPSANGFTVSCTATDNNEIKNVQFAVWSVNGGQDDLVYHPSVQDGTTWSCAVNTGDGHGSEADCTYAIQLIATDMNGNQTTTTINHYVDATPPVISDVVLTPQYNGKFRVTCTVTDDCAVDEVKGVCSYSAGTKTMNYAASESGSSYAFTVSCTSLSGEAGYYTTRINAYDTSGNLTTQTVFVYIDALAPVISDVRVSNLTKYGFDVSCLIDEDATGITGVQFPAWTAACADDSGNSQDDLEADWETSGKYDAVQLENGRWTYHVSFADHNGETGIYHVSIRVKDGFGNSSSHLVIADAGAGEESALSAAVRASGEFDGHTYVIYEYTNAGSSAPILNWNEAQSLCSSMGGHLATITSAEENAFVNELFSSASLYVPNFLSKKQAWIGAQGTGSAIEWVTGEPLDYTNWYRLMGQPSSRASTYAVAFWANGVWGTVTKSTAAAFICEFEPRDLSGMDTLTLPQSITEVATESFAGIAAQVVVLPEECTAISPRAFADCPNLEYLIVPSGSAIEIAEDAFAGSDVTIIEQ